MHPLRLPVFRRLLTAYTVNETGDSIALVALAFLVYDRTQSPIATTALLLATRVIPAGLATVLVARIDQGNPNRVLYRLYMAEAAIFALLAWLSEAFWLPAILALGLLDGTLALAGRAMVRSSIASELVPRDLLREGNAIVNVAFALAAVGGAALGGLLIATLGVSSALLADAVSFFVIAGLMLTARGLSTGVALTRERLGVRVRAGLGFVAQHPRLRLLVAGQAAALVLFTLVTPIEVVYARETLKVGSAGFGALLAAWGAGIVVGSALFVVGRRVPVRSLVLGSTGVIGLAYIGLSQTDTLAMACGLSVLGGTGNGIQWVAVVTALQRATPPELQARVVGLLESISAAAPGVGFIVGGALTTAGSPTSAYAVAGWSLLALVGACALALVFIPASIGLGPDRPSPDGGARPVRTD